MRKVDRISFVPQEQKAVAYADAPLPIGFGQTISQPYIVALMSEMLNVRHGEKVLEIGTGSGYQFAVLKELTPHVYGVELKKELADPAVKYLRNAGYRDINIKLGDGYEGWEEHAPFDKIIVTAAAVHAPPPLIKQLECGGRMVLPLGGRDEVQYLTVLTKDGRGRISEEKTDPVRFVPMLGRAQEKKK